MIVKIHLKILGAIRRKKGRVMWVEDRKLLPWEIPMVSLNFLKNS